VQALIASVSIPASFDTKAAKRRPALTAAETLILCRFVGDLARRSSVDGVAMAHMNHVCSAAWAVQSKLASAQAEKVDWHHGISGKVVA